MTASLLLFVWRKGCGEQGEQKEPMALAKTDDICFLSIFLSKLQKKEDIVSKCQFICNLAPNQGTGEGNDSLIVDVCWGRFS